MAIAVSVRSVVVYYPRNSSVEHLAIWLGACCRMHSDYTQMNQRKDATLYRYANSCNRPHPRFDIDCNLEMLSLRTLASKSPSFYSLSCDIKLKTCIIVPY